MKIAIGSVLKPLDDVRHYHKLGISLANHPHTELSIFGRATPYPPVPSKENISFQAITPVQPNWSQRLLSPWKFFLFLIKVKPELIIACTHELLIVIALYRILFGAKTIYDVQENYAENIRNNPRFSSWKKMLVALWIRTKERGCSPFINGYWLAETCYQRELAFLGQNTIVLENKSLHFKETKEISLASLPIIKLLFSGTIAKENGVLDAVSLVIGLHSLDTRYQLSIVGCCHQAETEKEIRALTKNYLKFIHLEISKVPLPYEVIQEAIFNTHMGLVCYRNQRNFRDKMPTKLYEYSTAGLPILLQNNIGWNQFCEPLQNAIILNFQAPDYKAIHQQIQKKLFYPFGNASTKAHTWQEEEKKLYRLLQERP